MNRIINKGIGLTVMSKLEACLGSKVYTLRKQYPVIREFEKRIKVVEKELNRGTAKKTPRCADCGKPMWKNVCKNRQKR